LVIDQKRINVTSWRSSQAAAYRTHDIRVTESEQKIKEAITSLMRMKKSVTKMGFFDQKNPMIISFER
jgi:hypothetical protein